MKNPPTPDWPAPFELLQSDSASPFLLVCEHAANHVPQEYQRLGLTEACLQRHIAWDPGAGALTRALAARMRATAMLGAYSRLLIDLNRPLHAADSITTHSEATPIPGNVGLSDAERSRRIARIFAPFQDRLGALVQQRCERGQPTVLVAIHSFTPVFHGQQRPWHAGVLFKAASDFAHTLIKHLRDEPTLIVDANVPYSVSGDADYALLVHGDDVGNPAVLIEVRHDLLATAQGVDEWAQRLERALLATHSTLT